MEHPVEKRLCDVLRNGRHLQYLERRFKVIDIDGMTVCAEGETLEDVCDDWRERHERNAG